MFYLSLGFLSGCTGQPARDRPSLLREVFPHVRVDAVRNLIEFDGTVPIDCHNPKTPRIFLEQVVCGRDSREHESLVVTDAKPSHLHAALLLVGLEPGSPGRWYVEDNHVRKVGPTGPRLRVTLVTTDSSGHETESTPEEWVVNARDGSRFAADWVFAGSRTVPWQGREFYDADGTGTVIGLTTFGSEVIAPSAVLSPEASLEDPEWIADPPRVPACGSRVVVRVRAEPR